MARKKQAEAPKGSPAWMATFSDLMNLLLCFFVLLFAMSSVDAAKFEQLAASFSQTFSIFSSGGSTIGDETLIGNGVSQMNNLDDYINNSGVMSENEPVIESGAEGDESGAGESEGENTATTEADKPSDSAEASEESVAKLESQVEEEGLKQSEEIAKNVEEAVKELGLDGDVSMNVTAQYVQLTMRGSILFDSGRAELKEGASSVLDRVGVILERYADGTIEIEGHTDNVPISGGGKYASNDELSSARALSVFQYLVSTTSLDPARMKHSGRGSYVPVADNSTPEGRAANRRVEIRIYNSLSSEQ
ncbi:MAG: flagellar motor protein MotB [Lachnospiraceae bacterium]|nr:flagellar motor protein MotB [Lachnospiraceae bacterium]